MKTDALPTARKIATLRVFPGKTPMDQTLAACDSARLYRWWDVVGRKRRRCSGVRACQRSSRTTESSGLRTEPSGRRKPAELSNSYRSSQLARDWPRTPGQTARGSASDAGVAAEAPSRLASPLQLVRRGSSPVEKALQPRTGRSSFRWQHRNALEMGPQHLIKGSSPGSTPGTLLRQGPKELIAIPRLSTTDAPNGRRFAVLTTTRSVPIHWIETSTRAVTVHNPATGPRASDTGRPSF